MKKKINLYHIFMIVSGASAILSLLMLSVFGVKLTDLAAFDEARKMFVDFIIHVKYAGNLNEVYSNSIHACFPPLIYLFYHVISFMVPDAATTLNYYDFHFPAVIYLILALFAFLFACKKYMAKKQDGFVICVVALITLSSSFAYGVIQCANVAFVVLILLMLACILRESENKKHQELALILIAIAAAIKIYPAVFGLIYLFERKWSQAIRLIVYGVLFFFVPFAFTGGLEGFNTFLYNLTMVQESWGYQSPIGLFNNLVALGLSSFVSKCIDFIICAVCVLLIPVTKVQWKRLFLLTFIMVMCPFWSGAYMPAFFVLPFLYMLKGNQEVKGAFNVLYTFLFSLIFTSSCFSFDFSAKKEVYCACVMFVLIIIDTILELKNKRVLTS